MLRDAEEAPESLQEDANAISAELAELNRDLTQLNRSMRGAGSIGSVTARPTDDQLWQIDQAWDMAPDLVTRVNRVITNRMPAFYDQLNEHGIRPEVGEAVGVPARPGN